MLLNNHPRPLLRFIALLLCATLSGCGISYIGQATRGQLAVMRARVPIDKVINQPTTSDTLKAQLLRAKRIRDFASTELALPNNAAYRSYADIHRPYVVWNVVAAPALSTTPRHWCFPVAGCVAYRGYFREKSARAFAATLQGQGDDVLVGGVAAYSTLGRIADPLLSTVTGYDEFDLAALVFHELAHQVVYLPGDSSFNEAFATTVEEAGLARYAVSRDDAAALKRWLARRALRLEINNLFLATQAKLNTLFESAVSVEEKHQRKAAHFAQLGDSIRATEKRYGRASGYGAWVSAGLNNANLASVATYYERIPAFVQMLDAQCGSYLPCFYVLAQRSARQSKASPQKKTPP
jgi:predicted aminopeptidase